MCLSLSKLMTNSNSVDFEPVDFEPVNFEPVNFERVNFQVDEF